MGCQHRAHSCQFRFVILEAYVQYMQKIMDKISLQKCFVDTSWFTLGKAWNAIFLKEAATPFPVRVVFNFRSVKNEICKWHTKYQLKSPDDRDWPYIQRRICKKCHPTVAKPFSHNERSNWRFDVLTWWHDMQNHWPGYPPSTQHVGFIEFTGARTASWHGQKKLLAICNWLEIAGGFPDQVLSCIEQIVWQWIHCSSRF